MSYRSASIPSLLCDEQPSTSTAPAPRAWPPHGHLAALAASVHAGKPAGSNLTLSYDLNIPNMLMRQVKRSRLDLPVSGSEPVYDERDGRWFGRRANRLHGAYSWALQDNEEGRQEVALPGDIAHELQELPGLDEKPVVTCRDLAVQVLADNPGLVTCVPAGERCPQGQHKLMAFIQPPSRPPPLGTPYMVPHHFYVQHKDVWIQMRRGDRVADVASFFKIPPSDIYAANPSLRGMTPDAPLQRDAPLPIFLPDVNVWSHKPEPDQPPCLHDGSGRVIRDPRQADPDYQEEIKDERGGTMTYTLALPDTYCTSFCVLKGQVKTGAPL